MKTAIEQLIEDLDTFLFDFTIEKKHEKSIKDIWNKAKEIEKEQITDAYYDGSQDAPIKVGQSIQYYNEKFNKI